VLGVLPIVGKQGRHESIALVRGAIVNERAERVLRRQQSPEIEIHPSRERRIVDLSRLRDAGLREVRGDEAIDRTVVTPVYATSRNFLWRIIDNGLIDGFFVNGSAALARGFGWVGSRLQTGNVGTYAWVLVVGVLVMLGALTLR